MAQTQHICPKADQGMIPSIIMDAGSKGQIGKVLTWLKDGGDVNAADMHSQTLAFNACALGQVDLLKELLQIPNIHLNQLSKQNSVMLNVACSRGHYDCVEALLASPSECKVDLNRKVANISAITHAARQSNWKIVDLLLKAGMILEENEAASVMGIALNCNEANIVRDIFKQGASFKTQTLHFVLMGIYKQNIWDDTGADEIFKRAIFNRNDQSLRVLNLVLEKKDWKKLEDLFRMLNDAVKINVSLVEAVLEKKSEDVERLLEQEQMEDAVMNGTLLIASIGGTSEEIVDLLFGPKYNYSAELLNYVLILACMYTKCELLPILFRRESYSYTTLSRAKMVIIHQSSALLVDRALKKLARDIIPIDEDDVNDTEK